MKIPHTRRLALEPIEDRLTPSRGWEPAGPRPDAVDVSPPHFRELPGRGERGDRDGTPDRPLFLLTWVSIAPATEETVAAPVQERSTSVKVASPPAAQVREPAPTAAVTRPTVPNGGVTANITDRPAVPVSAVVSVAPPAARLAEGQPVRATADKPVGPTAAENAWPVVFVGAAPEATAPRPAADSPTPDDGPAKVVLEEAPKPGLVERTLEAILPGGVPLHGVLPLAGEWIETGAADLLAGLESLGEDAGGVPLWEQMTWLAGAVLVLGGVTYTVGTNRGRRQLHRAVIGTDSALARWEDQNARRTTA